MNNLIVRKLSILFLCIHIYNVFIEYYAIYFVLDIVLGTFISQFSQIKKTELNEHTNVSGGARLPMFI